MILVEGEVGALWTPRIGTSLVDKTTEGFLEEARGPPAGRTAAGRGRSPGLVEVAAGRWEKAAMGLVFLLFQISLGSAFSLESDPNF